MDNNANSNVIEIPISEDMIDYIEMLDYEIAGLRVLYGHCLARGDIPEEKCEEIKGEFLEKYKELQALKSEIEAEYLADVPSFKSWNIIYNRRVLVCHV